LVVGDQRVVFQLGVDPEPLKRGLKQSVAGVQELDREAKKARDSLAGLGGADLARARGFDPTRPGTVIAPQRSADARRPGSDFEDRYAREKNQRDRDRQYEDFRKQRAEAGKKKYGSEFGGDEGGGGGLKELLGGVGLARVATPLFALHALGAGLEAAGKEFRELQTHVESIRGPGEQAGIALGNVAAAFVKGVPIIGRFVEAFEQFHEALSGRAEAEARFKRNLGQVDTHLQRDLGEQQARFQEQQGVRALERPLADAGTQARVAERANRRLAADPALRQSFTPDLYALRETGREFTESAELGEARQQQFTAGQGAEAARETAEQRAKESREAEARAAASRAQRDRTLAEERETRAAHESAQRNTVGRTTAGAISTNILGAAAGNIGVSGALGALNADRSGAERAHLQAADKAAQAERESAQAAKDGAEALAAKQRHQEALTNAARAEGELRKADLAVARARLALARQEEESAHGRAQFFGGAQPGQSAVTLQAYRQFKQGGIGALSPELLGTLEGVPGLKGQLDVAKEKRAEADPNYQAFLKESGLKGVKETEAARQKLEGEVTLKFNFDEGELKKQFEAVLKATFEGLREALKQVAIDEIDANNVALRRSQLQQQPKQ
jgi:hypothetical protein